MAMAVIDHIKDNKAYWAGLAFWAFLMLLSVFGIVTLIQQGLSATGMWDRVPMGIWLTFYIFFTGLSAGSFVVSTLYIVFGIKRYKAVARRAVILALIFLVNAPIFLLFDLGRIDRFLNVYLYWNPTSPLAWGARLLLLYPAVLLVELWTMSMPDIVELAKESKGWKQTFYKILALGKTELTEKQKKLFENLTYWLGIIGIPVAFATHGYTGFLLSVIKAYPVWSTPMMPPLFITSAMVSGAAALAITVMITDWTTKSPDTLPPHDYSSLLAAFLAIDFGLLLTEVITVFISHEEAEIAGWEVLFTGQLAISFWVFEILIGVLIPGIIVFTPQLKGKKPLVILASLGIVIGVLAKRINLIIGGQFYPKMVPTQINYAPTITEYLILLGGIAAVNFMFMVIWGLLPAEKTQIAVESTSESTPA